MERKKLAEAEAVAREVVLHATDDDLGSISVRAFAHLTLARVLSAGDPGEADVHFRSALEAYALLPMADHPERTAAGDAYEAFRKRQYAGRRGASRHGKSALRRSLQ
jgi:hypothetical protein